MYKPAMSIGAMCALIAVVLGAFGAHALKKMITPEDLLIYEKGVQYQFYHSFALLVTGIAYMSFPLRSLRLATNFFLIGIIFFCGSLYAITLLKIYDGTIGAVGIVTPIGGVCLILGWLLLFLGILKQEIKM